MCVWLVGLVPWCVSVEFLLVGVGRGVPAMLLEDAYRVGVSAFPVAVPFAGAAHVVRGHAVVVDEHAFECCVEMFMFNIS